MTAEVLPAKCVNKGCGKSFTSNGPTACTFHPGAPIFHEGLKGYSCCGKRVADFDEFLALPGCQVGEHAMAAAATATAVSASAASAPPATAGSKPAAMAPQSGPTSKPAGDAFIPTAMPDPKASVVSEADLADAPDAVIAPGTTCKRRGCGTKYGEGSAIPTCSYHPGTPVFHEGSKGWTCCSRKVLEFDEFLKIPGCTSGKHRFTDGMGAAAGPKTVECRHDWYQTQATVILSVFGKGMDASKSTVTFQPQHLTIQGTFKNGDVFTFDTPLFQPIEPTTSTYVVLSTKLELTLRKANGISWPSLRPTKDIVSFTTFGTHGQVGTVGAREAIVAPDSVVDFLRK